MFMWTTIANSLSQVADHPMSSSCWVDRAGPVLAQSTMHSNDVASASSPVISLFDILQSNMVVTPHTWFEWTIQQSELFGYSSTAVEGYKRCSGYSGSSIFTSSYRAVLKTQRCGSKHLVPNSHVGLIECNEDVRRLFPTTTGFFFIFWLPGTRRSA